MKFLCPHCEEEQDLETTQLEYSEPIQEDDIVECSDCNQEIHILSLTDSSISVEAVNYVELEDLDKEEEDEEEDSDSD